MLAMLEHGANTESVSGLLKSTPMQKAARWGHERIVWLLISRGANAMAKDMSLTTVLHCTAQGGNTAVVKLLLDEGADVTAEDDHGRTSMHCAIRHNQPAVERILHVAGSALAPTMARRRGALGSGLDQLLRS